MKKRISCEIIRDLLPLYVDGQTRPDTSRIISEHLSACPECARMYEEMNTPFPPAANDTPSVLARFAERHVWILWQLCAPQFL